MYLGSWKIDDVLTFPANTHRFDTGVATDADSTPSYRVYEDETGTPILTGSMALLDSTNTAGFYSEQITLSAANGFEKGKCYTIYISATVNSVEGTMAHTFQVEAEVDANVVSGGVNVTQLGGSSSAAQNLADSASAIYSGTITGASPTTTTLVDTGLTSGQTDNYVNRVLIFTSGTLLNQLTLITAFNPATDTLTFETVTAAPAQNDTYVIL